MEGIIVILLLIVAIVVFLLYTRARHPKTPAAVELTRRLGTVRYMSGAQFEGFVAEIMRGLGYRATVLGGSGDQGVDVIATAGKERIAIQCKNYAKPVGNKPVQEVYAGSRYHGCNSEWVVAPTGFTKGAVELARRLGVTLYDAQAIRTWIRRIDEKERDRGKKKPALQPRGTVDLDAGSAGQKEDTAMESGMEKHTMYVGKETLGETVSFTAKLLGIAGVNGGKEAEGGFDFSYYRLPDHTYRVLIDGGDLAILMPSNMMPSNMLEAWARGEPVEYGRWTLEELQAEQDFGRVFRELMKKYPESKQRVVRDLEEEEGAPEFEKGSGGIAGMGVCVDDVLASVRGVVDLSPHEALDEAQEFLTRQGYSLTYRTTTTLTVKRQVSDNATGQESIFKLIVMALPQSGGGVRIKVRGDDREAVRDHQAAWLEWSETLPKRETEQPEAAATMESVTREIVGQEAPRPTTAAANNAPQRRYCSNCGHQLAEKDRFCTNCGTPVH